MIRAIIDGRPMCISKEHTAALTIRVDMVTEYDRGPIAEFTFQAQNAHIVSTGDGARLRRVHLADPNGDTVANLVNLDQTADELARSFHESYEKLAPSFGYDTREASAKPWEDVPPRNRWLMTATVARAFGVRPEVELPVGVRVVCEECAWTGYDYDTLPPNAACPSCGDLFSVTAQAAKELM